MTQPLETIAISPLTQSYLCPQCEAVANTQQCPICGSSTIMLARVLAANRGSAAIEQKTSSTTAG